MNKLITLFMLLAFFSCNTNKHIIKYEVDSESMIPCIYPEDYIYVDTSVKEFSYGDIIVYRYLGDNSVFYNDLFRIVGLPNDSIAVQGEICIINGIKNPNKKIGMANIFDKKIERFPNGVEFTIYACESEWVKSDRTAVKIPKNHYFLLGDWRTRVPDSRSFGAVPKEQIIGKIVKIVSMHE